jgi:hypothetical protein
MDAERGEPEQDWFWSEFWQEAEREVDEELAAGNYDTFDSMEEFLRGLEFTGCLDEEQETGSETATTA